MDLETTTLAQTDIDFCYCRNSPETVLQQTALFHQKLLFSYLMEQGLFQNQIITSLFKEITVQVDKSSFPMQGFSASALLTFWLECYEGAVLCILRHLVATLVASTHWIITASSPTCDNQTQTLPDVLWGTELLHFMMSLIIICEEGSKCSEV